MKNMSQMMKQVKKLQAQMEKAQQEIEASEFEGTAGGGVVKVRINGKKEVLAVTIDPQVVDPDDVEMLQDLIVAAVNEAIKAADEMIAKQMGRFTGGLNIPGL